MSARQRKGSRPRVARKGSGTPGALILILATVGAGTYLALRQPVAANGPPAAPAIAPATAPARQAEAEAEIRLSAESAGMWFREYTIDVLDRRSGRPIPGPLEVSLVADHKEMPGSHTQRIRLQQGAQPGRYQGRTGPVMVGPWDVRVTVTGTVQATRDFTDVIPAP